MTTTAIQYISVKQLEKSALNMRKSEASKSENDQLKASIKAQGLQQNLIVFPQGKTKFGVVAGGRRFTQILELVKEKHFKTTDTFPCKVAKSEQEAIELSVVENTHRANAHPADEFEAYQAAIDAGSNIKDIASKFGQTQKHVKQRLKLANVAPEIIQEFRDKNLTLDCVIAFTIESDHKKQNEALKALQEHSHGIQPHRIKQLLTQERISSESPIAKYIDIKVYKKRGGTVTSDLFATESYLDDSQLAIDIATEKLTALAEEASDGWGWFEAYTKRPDQDYIYSMPKIEGEHCEKLSGKLKTTENEIDELENKEYAEDLTKQEQARLEELEKLRDETEDKLEETKLFNPAEMALAGLIVYLNHAGTPEFHMGLVRTGDRPALQALQQVGTPPTSNQASTEEPESTNYSQALVDDLTATRKVIAQAHLAKQPELALDLLHYNACLQILSNKSWGYSADIRTSRTYNNSQHPSVADNYEPLCNMIEKLNTNWANIDDKRERFQAFCALPEQDKRELTAYCTALTLRVELTNHAHNCGTSEEIISQLDIDWASHWTPNKANFLSRVNKTTMIDSAKEFMPEEWPAQAEKKKKGDLVAELEQVFQGNDERLSPEQTNQALNWMPCGF